MNSTATLMGAILGFIVGYVGWYGSFRLAGPLAKLLTSEWTEKLYVARVSTLVLSHIFLLTLMFALLHLIVLFINPSVETSKSVREAVVLASFVGFISFGIVPKLEARLKGVAQFKDRRDKS